MGITTEAVKFLIEGLKYGVNYENTITLGKQNLFVSPKKLEYIFKVYKKSYHQNPSSSPYFADSLFSSLGAKKVWAIDNSDYEGANIIHDLNQPIDYKLFQNFDVVFDGGLLEHVFNFPIAIKIVCKWLKLVVILLCLLLLIIIWGTAFISSHWSYFIVYFVKRMVLKFNELLRLSMTWGGQKFWDSTIQLK